MLRHLLQMKPDVIAAKTVDHIKEKISYLRRDGVVIGLSGGVDSSLVCALSVRAAGNANVLGLIMPEKYSSSKSKEYAELLARELKIKTEIIEITPYLASFGVYDLLSEKEFNLIKAAFAYNPVESKNMYLNLQIGGSKYEIHRKFLAHINIKVRTRAVICYYKGELKNYLVCGTLNRTDGLLGRTVKHGQFSDIDPIKNLYKTQIYILSEYLGIPRVILDVQPFPDLFPGFSAFTPFMDSSVLSYEKIDCILMALEKGVAYNSIVEETGAKEKDIEYIERIIELGKHKIGSPEGPFFEDDGESYE